MPMHQWITSPCPSWAWAYARGRTETKPVEEIAAPKGKMYSRQNHQPFGDTKFVRNFFSFQIFQRSHLMISALNIEHVRYNNFIIVTHPPRTIALPWWTCLGKYDPTNIFSKRNLSRVQIPNHRSTRWKSNTKSWGNTFWIMNIHESHSTNQGCHWLEAPSPRLPPGIWQDTSSSKQQIISWSVGASNDIETMNQREWVHQNDFIQTVTECLNVSQCLRDWNHCHSYHHI